MCARRSIIRLDFKVTVLNCRCALNGVSIGLNNSKRSVVKIRNLSWNCTIIALTTERDAVASMYRQWRQKGRHTTTFSILRDCYIIQQPAGPLPYVSILNAPWNHKHSAIHAEYPSWTKTCPRTSPTIGACCQWMVAVEVASLQCLEDISVHRSSLLLNSKPGKNISGW